MSSLQDIEADCVIKLILFQFADMAAKTEQGLSENCYKMVIDLQNAKTSQDTVEYYNEWANDYESDENALNYRLHIELVEFLEAVWTENNKSTLKILDIGAGTGLVAEVLRKKGIGKQIDAVDGSDKMLEKAKKKGLYDSTYCHVVETKTDMPAELACGSYDVVTLCAAMMRTNMIQPGCVRHFVNSVRPGGLIVFSLTTPIRQEELEFNITLERESFRLQQEGRWQLVNMRFVKKYRDSMVERTDEKNISAYLYCYKRLK